MDNDKLEAVRNVVDRVTSYQDSAPEGTVEAELRNGLGEAEVQLDDAQVQALAQAIEEDPADVDVAGILS